MFLYSFCLDTEWYLVHLWALTFPVPIGTPDPANSDISETARLGPDASTRRYPPQDACCWITRYDSCRRRRWVGVHKDTLRRGQGSSAVIVLQYTLCVFRSAFRFGGNASFRVFHSPVYTFGFSP